PSVNRRGGPEPLVQLDEERQQQEEQQREGEQLRHVVPQVLERVLAELLSQVRQRKVARDAGHQDNRKERHRVHAKRAGRNHEDLERKRNRQQRRNENRGEPVSKEPTPEPRAAAARREPLQVPFPALPSN